MNSLEHAVAFGDHVMVKTLLDTGADPNIPGKNNKTPLHWAAKAGHHAIVEILLGCGADPNLVDTNGRTALNRAAFKGHHTIVETLLSCGANPNIPDNGHHTALHWAACFGRHAIVTTLIKKGADPNLKTRAGWTALQYAALSDHLDVCKTLLAQTHQPDWNRLLQTFSYCGWKEQVEEALVNGADPNILIVLPYSRPLHLAAGAGHRDIVETLLANGADPKLRDSNGRTACQCARAEPIKEAIHNFMSAPHSLQFYCRASIRSRLIKYRPDNGLPIKEAAGKLSLPAPMAKYVYCPLSL